MPDFGEKGEKPPPEFPKFDDNFRSGPEWFTRSVAPGAEAEVSQEINMVNPRFDRIRRLLPVAKWEEMVAAYGRGAASLAMEDAVLCAYKGSNLREFNQDAFDSRVSIGTTAFGELARELKNETNIQKFIYYAGDLKALDPVGYHNRCHDVVHSRMNEITEMLELNRGNLLIFVSLLAEVIRIEPVVWQAVSVSQKEWESIVKIARDRGSDDRFFVADAQIVQPPGMKPDFLVSEKTWRKFVDRCKNLADKQEYDDLIEYARRLVHMRVKYKPNRKH